MLLGFRVRAVVGGLSLIEGDGGGVCCVDRGVGLVDKGGWEKDGWRSS